MSGIAAGDFDIIIPQHGSKYFKGKAMVNAFINWVEGLHCGVDLMSTAIYRVPPPLAAVRPWEQQNSKGARV